MPYEARTREIWSRFPIGLLWYASSEGIAPRHQGIIISQRAKQCSHTTTHAERNTYKALRLRSQRSNDESQRMVAMSPRIGKQMEIELDRIS